MTVKWLTMWNGNGAILIGHLQKILFSNLTVYFFLHFYYFKIRPIWLQLRNMVWIFVIYHLLSLSWKGSKALLGNLSADLDGEHSSAHPTNLFMILEMLLYALNEIKTFWGFTWKQLHHQHHPQQSRDWCIFLRCAQSKLECLCLLI